MTVAEVLKWMEIAERGDLEQIAAALIDRDFAASMNDDGDGPFGYDESSDEIDPELLTEAAVRLRRGDFGEALHILANALGPDFARLDDVPVPA